MSKRRSIKLTEEELAKVIFKQTQEINFEDALEKFIHHAELRGLRKVTIYNYRTEIGRCLHYLSLYGVVNIVSDVTKYDLEKLVIHMQEQGISNGSINARLKVMKVFYNWMHEEKLIKKNHMKEIKLLNYNQAPIYSFDPKQIKMMISKCANDTFTGIRDKAVLLILIESGIRSTELCQLRIEEIQLEKGQLLVSKSKTYNSRIVPITKPTIQAIKLWLAIRGYSEHRELFITTGNKPLTPRLLQHIVTKYGKLAGVNEIRCSPHIFRHSFAKFYLQNGGNLFVLQQLMGHYDISITRKYVLFMQEDINKAHEKYSPLKGINL